MKVRKARKLRDILLLVGIFIELLGYIVWKPFAVIGVVVMSSCLIPHFMFNKCPNCGKHLGGNEGEFCPFCGKPIDD